ncbi:MAG: methyltransferase domain-containing protein [Pseudomonadota bacterium]
MNLENSQQYYGKVLASSDDLKTDACCTLEAPPVAVREALANVHEDVTSRYYGCGLVAPEALEGLSILDLGSGTGQDAYVLAQLVGPKGRVVGVDATPEQLAIANGTKAWHADRFGFDNVSFLEGDIERLGDLPLDAGSFDVIVSNCVINLVADKPAVFREAFRLLRQGGELYFSDVYADRRIPQALQRDPVLHGECISGALYWGDFDRLAREAGFDDPRLVTDRPLAIGDAEQQAKVEGYRFTSATYRLFKVEGLERQNEDYGQAVRYLGSIPGHAQSLAFDGRFTFDTGRPVPVCGNTFLMLQQSRFADHFDFMGDTEVHHGPFPGASRSYPYTDSAEPAAAGCC